MTRVITTVGTSLFTNYKKKETRDLQEFEDNYCEIDTAFDNLEKNSMSASDITNDKFEVEIDHIKTVIKRDWLLAKRCEASAEIKSLIEIAKEEGDLEVVLLATDTVLSVLACTLICEWFNQTYPSVKVEKEPNITCLFVQEQHVITGLQVKDADTFKSKGFQKLLELLKEHSNKKTIFNISGGYKAIIPFMTLYGQLKNIELRYIYEDSSDLISITKLPIDLDWAIVEALKPFLNSYFLAEPEIKAIGKYWNERKIKFLDKSNMFIGVDEATDKEFKALNINVSFQQLFNVLVNYQLITWSSENNNIVISSMGDLIFNFKFSIESNKGFIMESLLFKYFTLNDKVKETANYSTNTFIPKPPKTFVLEGKAIELGDIDVWLKYKDEKEEHCVWAEVKAISTATSYKQGSKYYAQLKSRILGLGCPYLETLFIVFRFVFKDINAHKPFIHEGLKPAISNLQGLNADIDLKDKSKFKCLGVSIPAKFTGNKIDITESFYKGDFSQWTWEELKVNDNEL